MNAVIYARYSCSSQREESIEGQLRECKAYADKNKINIVGTYIDRARSATTDNRPDFQKMISDSSSKNFNYVIVWKLDRFSRDRYDSAVYKALLKKNGVKVISATEHISDEPNGIILESMLEGMAEYYSKELSQKVIRGHHENALKSKFNGGTLTIGYKIDENRKYVIDPETAPFVVEAFKLYREGNTIKEIVQILNNKGMRNTLGTKMTITTVTNLLKNRKYLGEYRYGDVVNKGEIPQIVPEVLFDEVQKEFAKNRKATARHKATDDYLLTTKLVCNDCGSLWVGEIGTSRNGNKYRYYKCINAKRKKGCIKKKGLKKDELEDLVIQQIMKFLMNDEVINNIADFVLKEQKTENVAVPALKSKLKEIGQKIENLLKAIEDGLYTSSTKERLQSLEAEKSETEILIAKEEIANPMLSREDIIHWLTELRNIKIDSISGKKRLINIFINSIVVYDDRLLIVFNYRDGTNTVPVDIIKCSNMIINLPPKILVRKNGDFYFLSVI